MKKGFLSFAMLWIISVIMISFSACDSASGDTTTTSHIHEWGEFTVTKEATCLSEGQAERICVCGENDIKILNTFEHKGEYWIVDQEATYQKSQRKHQICSVCKTVFNESTIPFGKVTRLPGVMDTDQDELRPNYELANCRRLENTPVVVLLFIDDDESHWTYDEAVSFLDKQILPGLHYLEDNAQKWGVSLDFTIETYATSFGTYTLSYDGTVNKNLLIGGSTKDVLDQAASDLGYDSNWDFYSYYKSIYPEDEIIFLNFLNKSGKSYARHAISTGYLEYSEHCVIFADYLGSSPEMRKDGSRAATIAHELLHLFGAEDYYDSQSREALANQYYPDDIMLWQYDKIEDNVIGDCTAFSVGWTDTIPKVCYDDKWWR